MKNASVQNQPASPRSTASSAGRNLFIKVLGGGKRANLFRWRDKKKTSSAVLGGTTAIWIMLELIGYYLLTLVCYSFILTLTILFIWFNITTFIKQSPPNIPKVIIPEYLAVGIAISLSSEINRGLAALKQAVFGRDLKKFLSVIAGLYVFSIVGSWFSILTLLYIGFVLMHAVPLLYEKFQYEIDAIGGKVMGEIKKHFAALDFSFLSKIPNGSSKAKKR